MSDDNVSDHPTRHMVDIPIPVQVGETIQVNGYDFVITGLHVSIDEPPFLMVKSPLELQKKIPSAPNLKNFFEGVTKALSEAAEKQKNKPVGPFRVTPPIQNCTCGEFAGSSVTYADCPVHGKAGKDDGNTSD